MFLIALVVATLLALAFAVVTWGRRRPVAQLPEVKSMRTTLERKVREGAEFRF